MASKVNVKLLEAIIVGKSKQPSPGTLFEKLHASAGKKHAHSWFKQKCDGALRMEEGKALNFLRALTKRNDHELLDVVDLFGMAVVCRCNLFPDEEYEGSLSWSRFYIIVSLFAALAGGETVKFLYVIFIRQIYHEQRYKHGEDMFKILVAHGPPYLDFAKFVSFGWLLGISEEDLVQSVVNNFHIGSDRLREQTITLEVRGDSW